MYFSVVMEVYQAIHYFLNDCRYDAFILHSSVEVLLKDVKTGSSVEERHYQPQVGPLNERSIASHYVFVITLAH
jgi:hypothetical protein